MLTAAITALLMFPTFAQNPDDCARLLSDKDRVELALKKIFSLGDAKPSDELQKFDDGVAAEVLEMLNKLSPKKKENFLTVLENPAMGYFVDGFSPELNQPLVATNGAFALVRANKDGLTLAVLFAATLNPLARIALIHEASHLMHFVPEGPLSDSHQVVQAVLDRKLGLYREELNAFKHQYRFIKKYFTLDDIQKMKETNSPPTAQEMELLKEAGFLAEDGESFVIDPIVNCSPEALAAFVSVYVFRLNSSAIEYADDALTKSESECTKKWVRQGNYRTQQLTRIYLPYYARAMSWGKRIMTAAAALAAYYLLH